MSAQPPQNFENHSMIDKFFLVQFLIMAGLVILAGIGLAKLGGPSGMKFLGAAFLLHLLVAITLMMKMRLYSVKLQDRIIRLEMRLRLDKILPDALAEKAKSLTLAQLIALRFASDAEMPELVEKVLSENLQEQTPIKKLVKDWQPDHHRV